MPGGGGEACAAPAFDCGTEVPERGDPDWAIAGKGGWESRRAEEQESSPLPSLANYINRPAGQGFYAEKAVRCASLSGFWLMKWAWRPGLCVLRWVLVGTGKICLRSERTRLVSVLTSEAIGLGRAVGDRCVCVWTGSRMTAERS